jgi:uncharacterized protein (DUF1697 family)
MKKSVHTTGGTTYVAFLRGINVGGKNPIKMDALRKAFESSGFKNVKTVLASGNVIFDAFATGKGDLAGKIEQCIKKTFGKEIGVVVRSIEDIRSLVGADPFKGIKPTSQTRLYVTFLREKLKTKLKIPVDHSDKGFRIVHATAYEICIHLELAPGVKSTDLMQFLDREFGRGVTTRNWNTIARILKACDVSVD